MRACAARLPKLQAEESLLAVKELAIGLGRLEARDRESIVAEWLDAIDPDRPRVVRGGPAIRPPFGDIGIGVHVIDAVNRG